MVGIDQPVNKIVALGAPLVRDTVTADATIKPGFLVKYSAADKVVVGTAACKPVGWAGYEHASFAYRPASISTAYASGDTMPLLFGGGFVIMATLADGNTITEGDLLVAAATGQVAEAAAIAETATSRHINPTVGSLLPGGPVVGAAVENVTTSGAAAYLLVHSFI